MMGKKKSKRPTEAELWATKTRVAGTHALIRSKWPKRPKRPTCADAQCQ